MSLRIDGNVMRIRHMWLLAGVVLPTLAGAMVPSEMPPDDYAGAQYIDSSGCVFLRQGSVWQPRLDRDGSVICGYPPSLTARVGASEGPDHAAQQLAAALAEGLQNGDVKDDPDDPLRREPAPTPRADSQRMATLGAAVDALPTLRASVAGEAGRSGQLCDLLGYPATGANASADGATLGICGGGGDLLTPRVLADQRGSRDIPAEANGSADVSTPVALAAAAVGATRGKTAATTKTKVAATAPSNTATKAEARRADRAKKQGADDLPGAEMVPAGARFIQVGRFAAPQADVAIRRLRELGYPVVRSTEADAQTGSRLIMAGPFADRRAVIAALNHLRASAYPSSFAR